MEDLDTFEDANAEGIHIVCLFCMCVSMTSLKKQILPISYTL